MMEKNFLTLKNVSVFLKNKKCIVDNVSLSLESGDIACITGPSGSGKTTFLRALNNLEKYAQGTISLNGEEMDIATMHKRGLIGMVFQDYNIFIHMTVAENIALALQVVKKLSKKRAQEKALAFLERFGLLDKASHKASALSGGQKQRLAIARTLALNPLVICFDEPTAALDPDLTEQFASYINDLSAEGRIILLSTHDISFVDSLNCLLYKMDAGTLTSV